jgi:hypothetical protein
MQDTMEMITDELTPRLRELVPGGTTYLSEGDFRDPEWKQSFYGANYESLEKIKNKYDPDHLFYALTVSSNTPVDHYCERLLTFYHRLLVLITGSPRLTVVFARREGECLLPKLLR